LKCWTGKKDAAYIVHIYEESRTWSSASSKQKRPKE
jgi:hypothetical protein